MKLQFKSRLVVLLIRLLLVYVAFMLCRVLFYTFNDTLIDPVSATPVWSLIKGSLMFDTVSIIYINLLFIFLSLIPLRVSGNKKYQNATFAVFMVFNGLGMLVNVADIFYYPFKQARIVLGDFVLLKDDSFLPLLGDFVADYWYGFLFYFGLIALLWWGYKAVGQKAQPKASNKRFYIEHAAYVVVMGVLIAFFIRGATFSASSYPITMNDAFLYTENPTHTSVILSNPFCILRTIGRSKDVPNLKYFDESVAQNMAPTTHTSIDWDAYDIDRNTNVFVIILESFGKAHIKSFSDQFKPGQETNTPFIDSIMQESYVFTNTFQNGRRSIDALPAIWASIPSFKDHFLSLPNSVAAYHGLPECMDEMGYQTAFFHGGVKESMGFVSFGKTTGIKNFYSREEYEAENGNSDFDGKWGIWDHKFLPYVHKKLNGMDKAQKPFFATLFTLSSHHPYSIPEGMENKFTEGTLPIHRAIKYSDYALGQFFNSIKNEPWFNNTLFIITADHSSGADSPKFNKQPYEYSIPLMFFKPGGKFKGKDDKVMQHMDIMPTLLGMLDYDKPYFAFGTDHFNKTTAKDHFAVNHSNGVYNCTTDDFCYIFNEKDVITKFAYKTDPLGKHNLISKKTAKDEATIRALKSFLQEYSTHVNNRDYLPKGEKQAKAMALNK